MAIWSTCKSSTLTIQLFDPKAIYYTGDVFRGQVTLELSKDTSIGTVTITFSAYTTSEISHSNGQSNSIFHGKSLLFELKQTLHHDHFTHKTGLLQWPFEFQVPTEFESSAVTGDEWKGMEGFLASNDRNVSLPLPPSFRMCENKTGKGWKACTLYLLKATIIKPEKSTSNTSIKSLSCNKTLQILPRPISNAVDLYDPSLRHGVSVTHTFASLKLLPPNMNNLSLFAKTLAHLKVAPLPQYTIEIDLSYITMIQLGHPCHVPFEIAAVAKTEPSLTTIRPVPETFFRYPTIFIRKFILNLESTTQCRCVGFIGDVTASHTTEIVLANRQLQDTRLIVRSMAFDQKNQREDSAASSIDLGKECDVHVPCRTLPHGKKSKSEYSDQSNNETLLAPSFCMHNISRSYHLTWSLQLECVGEKLNITGRSPQEITVLSNPAGSLALPENMNELDFNGEDDEYGEIVQSVRPLREDYSSDRVRDSLPAYGDRPPGYTTSIT